MEVSQIVDAVRQADANGGALHVTGSGSKAFLGEGVSSQAAALSLAPMQGVVNYEPTELVITAKAGTPLSLVEQTLDKQGQMLGFEPPSFAPTATIGGTVASGLSGPRRASAGACRDFVLGVGLVSAKGEALRFGGEVMKNVAGYDVSRLMCGSFGTLGVLTDVSLKVLPKPAARASVVLEVSQEQALVALNTWGGQPLPISASSWFDGQLIVRLEGANAAVASALKTIGGALLDDAQALGFWRDLREQQHAFFQQAAVLWRLSVPSVTKPLQLPSATWLSGKPGPWIEWGGAQRWYACASTQLLDQASEIRRLAAQAGGHASLFRLSGAQPMPCPERFHPLSAPVLKLHQRLKQELDPKGLFNPGRMYKNQA